MNTEEQECPGRWAMTPFHFKPIKHNPLIASLALRVGELRTRKLERLIFTATTGRSGTLTLTNLFDTVPGCRAVHEGNPQMNGSVLRAASYGDTDIVDRVYRLVKSVNIRRAAAHHRYYFEANHLFIKSFARNAIADFGQRVAVVHLVRPAIDVANSLYQLRDYPSTSRGDYWWLDYRAPTNLIAISDLLDSDPEFSHPYYKCLWYWHEVEARIRAWRAATPDVTVVDFETEWLNDFERVSRLMRDLGVEYDPARLAARIGIREHRKVDLKVDAALPEDEALQRVQRFEELLRLRVAA